MELVKHETCQQYVDRRLSEGWKIVWQKGYHLILSSPEGNILRPVDLRNDIETLRPNAPGDATSIAGQFPDLSAHWEKVDEEISDDDSTYVWIKDDTNEYDLYNLPNPSLLGTINSVTIYIRCRTRYVSTSSVKTVIKTEATEHYGNAEIPPLSYTLYSTLYITNPETGLAWTWAQINALQAGVWMTDAGANELRCTQVYVEVDYTPAPPAAPTNVQATDGAHTDKVVITWTKSTGATGYQVYRDGVALGWLGDVATYDDSGADAPTITPGAAAASDGTSAAHVALSLSEQSANNGTTHTYKVRARNATGESADSGTNTGYRGVGALSYQWQRSAGDSPASYTNIVGATTAAYNDIGAPADGSGRYYRCVENATGAAQQISSADRGYRIASPTVTAQPVSNIGDIGAAGNGNITDTGGEDTSAWGVCWNTTGNPTTADSTAAGSGLGGVGAFTALMTGLTPGQKYYVKAYATNSAGTGYSGEVSFTTKPSAPSNLTATTISETQINLTWTKGAGAENTVIRRRANAAPISVTDGVEVYNGIGTSHNDTTCDPGVHYYYRAWSYHPTSGYSDSYDTADISTTVAPTGTTEDATLIGDVNATLNGKVTDDGGESCQARFQYGTTVAYGINTAWQTGKVTGDTFSQRITGLTQLTEYHFRAQIKNSAGTVNGVDKTFTTIELPTPFLRRVLRDVFGSGTDINATNPLQVYDPKVFESLVVYEGTATADGPDTSTITDTVLAGKPDFNGQLVVITSGSYKGQTRDIDQATNTGGGKAHAAKAFDGTIVSGVTYKILSIRPTTAEVADIEAKLDNAGYGLEALKDLIGAVETKLDKLAGEAPTESSVTKNWNTAVDSPDGTGGLLVNLGTAATRKKLHSLLLDVSALTDDASIHIKLFIKINDTQRKVYDETFTIATDPDGLWIVNGTVGIHDVLSVAVYSDNSEDVAIGYTAMLEAM